MPFQAKIFAVNKRQCYFCFKVPTKGVPFAFIIKYEPVLYNSKYHPIIFIAEFVFSKLVLRTFIIKSKRISKTNYIIHAASHRIYGKVFIVNLFKFLILIHCCCG